MEEEKVLAHERYLDSGLGDISHYLEQIKKEF
jgi:hypothetical protein